MAEEKLTNENAASEVVTDVGKSGWSDLYTKEDYWAIWLGFGLIIIALLIFLPNPPDGMRETIAQSNAIMEKEAETSPFKTIAWHDANDAKLKVKADDATYAKTIAKWLGFPHGWTSNPIEAFLLSEEKAEAKKAKAMEKYNAAKENTAAALAAAQTAEDDARAENFGNESLNTKAKEEIGKWRGAKNAESSAKKKTAVGAYNQIGSFLGLCIILALFFTIGVIFMGLSPTKFLSAFPFVFLLAILAYMLEEQSTMKAYGIGYAAWAIIFGLLISNTIGVPKWLMTAVQTEYYIKTGLVLLGAEILFGKILAIGTPGIFVAWVVTPIVLVCTYMFGQRILKIPSKTLNITVSADMSVCGVSAAIATAAACRAKKEELTLAVGMSLIFTAIMMIVMPNFIKLVGMDHVLGGAWMGGTIDATGAVAAAGAFLSDRALYVAATIKMIQNIMIGVIAFCVAVYWCCRVERQPGCAVSAWEIWHRFPKFVLGFISASIIFSIIYQSIGSDVGYTMIDNGVIRGFLRYFREWFFCLAFVSIGLATNFRELKGYFKGGKPLILYVCGQSFNLMLTLLVAYIMFYLVFPDITAKI
ncbi:MAG: putative sulfate exporter family transporter [Candidatus Omnitrophota bacterium]|jgi:uncharacterized membrane protein YadS|nr:MAG: putative sulfate exporter family transporter [Candidatus Omnitrophota bacterium]